MLVTTCLERSLRGGTGGWLWWAKGSLEVYHPDTATYSIQTQYAERGIRGRFTRSQDRPTGRLRARNNKQARNGPSCTPSSSCFVTLCACPGASSAPSGCRRARRRWVASACSPLQCTGPCDPAPGTWASVSHQKTHPACTGDPQRRGREETVQRQ